MVPLDDVPQGRDVKFSLPEALRIKQEARASRAAQPIAEKLRTLERLRERARTIKAARVPTSAVRPK